MQYFRPGSQLRQLITMLSIVGEYPIRSLYLLGNERAYKALVHKLTTPETFRIPQTETELTTRLLTVTGKGNSRSVRFYKGALPISGSGDPGGGLPLQGLVRCGQRKVHQHRCQDRPEL